MARHTKRRLTPKAPKRRGVDRRWGLGLAIAIVAIAGVILWPRIRPREHASGARPFSSPVEVYELADQASKRGDYRGAYDILVRAVAQFPGDADVARAFGVTTNNLSYFVRPQRGRLVPVMATSLDRVGAAHAALAAYDRASAVNPRLAEPYHHRGNLYAAWGLPDDALRELYEARVRGDSTASLQRTAGAIVALQRGAMDPTLGEVTAP